MNCYHESIMFNGNLTFRLICFLELPPMLIVMRLLFTRRKPTFYAPISHNRKRRNWAFKSQFHTGLTCDNKINHRAMTWRQTRMRQVSASFFYYQSISSSVDWYKLKWIFDNMNITIDKRVRYALFMTSYRYKEFIVYVRVW